VRLPEHVAQGKVQLMQYELPLIVCGSCPVGQVVEQEELVEIKL